MSEVKILLCDDDPDLQGLLLRRLKKMGIEPDVAGDGRVAKGFVDENDYDVIVTDIYMPEATGLEVMEHAKLKDADTQVVIITSSATLDNAIDALNHGAFGYLTKPFDHLIVFDNMVSRALEYRQLIVADKRKAEAQRRRGDMLEDEVTQRVVQLQKTQKGLLDLLGSLPDGILVVEEGGKVVLSSPVGERWLAQDKKTEDQPIHVFVGQVHAEVPEPYSDVTVDGVDLHLMSADFPNEGDAKRKAVIIREVVEEDGAGAGSMVTETVMGIKKGLATLYEQGMGTEVVLNVASQFAVLEQLQGWSTGTGELNPEQVSTQTRVEAPPPDPSSDPEQSTAPDPAEAIEAQEPLAAPTPAEEVQAQAPSEPAAAPGPAQVPPEAIDSDPTKTVPPFTLPRERTPTGELGEPRMNTSELQNALRASSPADEHPAAAEPQVEEVAPQDSAPSQEPPVAESPAADASAPEASQEPPVAEVPAAEVGPDPMDETLVSSTAKETETPLELTEPPAEETIPPFHTDEPPAETEPPGGIRPESEAGPENPTAPTSSDAVVEKQPAANVPEIELEEQPATDMPQLESEGQDFPRAESGTDDVPTWIDGVQGTTDPDLLADFEFEPEEQEAYFPVAQTGDLLEDDSMFKPRVIPEAMDAKLKTPTELSRVNGDQERDPPQHDGPITIQASEADTKMFRNVLKGLSGTEVLSGDYEKPPEEPQKTNGDSVAKAEEGLDELLSAEEGLDELRSAVREAPEPEMPIEAPQTESPPPAPEELRQVKEPEPDPQPVSAEPANWPPTLPTKDDDWDDDLDVSG
jgi:DNA-binding response OmpR family regulator